MRKKKIATVPPESRQIVCPVCLSDRLDVISVRMKKCISCGFIWNHEVSDRDNLLLIVEHQTKMEPKAEPVNEAEAPRARKSGR